MITIEQLKAEAEQLSTKICDDINCPVRGSHFHLEAPLARAYKKMTYADFDPYSAAAAEAQNRKVLDIKETPYTGNPHDTRRVYTDQEIKELFRAVDDDILSLFRL